MPLPNIKICPIEELLFVLTFLFNFEINQPKKRVKKVKIKALPMNPKKESLR